MPTVADRFQTALTLVQGWGFPAKAYDTNWRGRSARPTDPKAARYIKYAPDQITDHHTGDVHTPDLMLFVTGRKDLPGPLAQWSVHSDGTIVLGAAGYGNGVGSNDRAAVDRVAAGAPLDAEIKPGPDTPNYSGNRRTITIECEAVGSYSTAQRASVVALNAALVIAFGWSKTRPPVGAHKEITRRKPGDPGDNMGQLRADVVAFIAGKETPVPTPPPVVVPPVVTPTPDTLARVSTLNCHGWNLPESQWTDADEEALIAEVERLNCSIYCLDECPEYMRDAVRSALPGGAERWLVVVRADLFHQAILFDSHKWKFVAKVPVEFGPTRYHGGVWATFVQIFTGVTVAFGVYHLPPNAVASADEQARYLRGFLAKAPKVTARLAGGDGADSSSWAVGWLDARDIAAASSNRAACTYGAAIKDRIFLLGVSVRVYTVGPAVHGLDHKAVLAQITIPAPISTN